MNLQLLLLLLYYSVVIIIIRKKAAFLMLRVRGSVNSILSVVADRLDCPYHSQCVQLHVSKVAV